MSFWIIQWESFHSQYVIRNQRMTQLAWIHTIERYLRLASTWSYFGHIIRSSTHFWWKMYQAQCTGIYLYIARIAIMLIRNYIFGETKNIKTYLFLLPAIDAASLGSRKDVTIVGHSKISTVSQSYYFAYKMRSTSTYCMFVTCTQVRTSVYYESIFWLT